MYNTIKEYKDAFLRTGLKVGDTVHLERGPISEDGRAVTFYTTRLWKEYYTSIDYYLGLDYVIHTITHDGLLSLDRTGRTTCDCEYIVPFFLLRGYDHHNSSLIHFSKSNFLKFDKMVEELNHV